jgi:hypothetical protein
MMAEKRQQPVLYQQEAERLAGLSARDRKAALDVHRRIANDTRLSEVTRNKLTAEGHTTRRGKPWNAVQVARVFERSESRQ